MGDGILNDQRVHAIRMGERHPEAHRSAVVLHEQGVLREVQGLREMSHHPGYVVEGIREGRGGRRIAVSESGIVGSDHVKLPRQAREQRLEHARRRR